jgi:F0F1-type ATP synthase assembly protein I
VTGTLGGLWLDKRLDSAPLWLLVGAVAGIALGMYQLIRSVVR